MYSDPGPLGACSKHPVDKPAPCRQYEISTINDWNEIRVSSRVPWKSKDFCIFSIPGVTSLLRTSTAVDVFVGPDTHTCILQLQRNPFLTPEESNTVDRKMREERCFELTRER
ncbi:hypothetical protein TNCV_4460821 [Trichonephila clavipes]|nr:hypothetical protein TNCV_4460821 [Trichonephila clavipes]